MSTRLRLSPHFTVEEFDTHDGRRVPAKTIPALRSLCVHFLEPLRDEFGPVAVASGYRHRAYNRRIGSTDGSFHVYDLRLGGGTAQLGGGACAADVVPASGDVDAWASWAHTWRRRNATLNRRTLGGVGHYPRSGFVHLDTGPRRDWAG